MISELMVVMIPKMLVGFALMVCYIHLSGKGALAPISSIDQVGNVVLGAIIGGTLFNPSINLVMFALAVVFWTGLLLLIRYISNKHMQIKDLVDGEAIRLIHGSRVLSGNFTKAGLAVRDFMMLLHQRGYKNLDELDDVWYEYNGQLTVVRKGDKSQAVVLVEDGEINTGNLERIGHDEEWLRKELKKKKMKFEEVFCGEWHDDRLWLYPYSDDGEKIVKKQVD